jgi:hypothetical protein
MALFLTITEPTGPTVPVNVPLTVRGYVAPDAELSDLLVDIVGPAGPVQANVPTLQPRGIGDNYSCTTAQPLAAGVYRITVTAVGDVGPPRRRVRQVEAIGIPDTVINFDVDPDGVSLADGTDVSTTYASLGVTFSFAQTVGPAPGPGVYAREPSFPETAETPPNVVSIFASGAGAADFGQRFGFVVATFDPPVRTVTVRARPSEFAPQYVLPVMLVYDGSGRQIGSAVYQPDPNNPTRDYQQLTFGAQGQEIVQVKLSCFDKETPPATGLFDQLSFHR